MTSAGLPSFFICFTVDAWRVHAQRVAGAAARRGRLRLAGLDDAVGARFAKCMLARGSRLWLRLAGCCSPAMELFLRRRFASSDAAVRDSRCDESPLKGVTLHADGVRRGDQAACCLLVSYCR